MFKKIVLIALSVILFMAVLVSPVAAKPGKRWDPDRPRPPYGWKMEITIYQPSFYYQRDGVLPPEYRWSYSINFSMPPSAEPGTLWLYQGDTLVYEFDKPITFEGSDLGYAGPVNVYFDDPPESIVYTFIFTSGSKTLTEDVTISFILPY